MSVGEVIVFNIPIELTSRDRKREIAGFKGFINRICYPPYLPSVSVKCSLNKYAEKQRQSRYKQTLLEVFFHKKRPKQGHKDTHTNNL